MPNEKKKPKTVFDEPEFWFTKLVRANEEGDWEDAAEASKNLARLLWDVKRIREPEVSA